MTLYHALSAGTLALIAVLHSVLGETMIIRPLLADGGWKVGLRRPFAEKVIRFAWHLTSVAWVALAATALGLEGPVALVAAALASGVIVVVLCPAHLSWPLFLAAALWGGIATGLAGEPLLSALAFVAVGVAIVAALLHVAWTFGIAAGAARAALPDRRDGEPARRPSRLATAMVAGALAVFATALTMLTLDPDATAARVLVAGAVVVLAARAIGDGRTIGFTKKVRTTPFGRRDDALFTPIVVILALGSTAALAL